MLQEKIKDLSWTQSLSIIQHYKPSEQRIGEIFGISKEKLQTLGIIFKPDPTFDVTPYYVLFEPSSEHPVMLPIPKGESHYSQNKKRAGRPGNNIINSFWNVPSTPVGAIEFAEKSNVSLSVLRQSKRFDKTNLLGKVHVRKNKDGILMIWRDK